MKTGLWEEEEEEEKDALPLGASPHFSLQRSISFLHHLLPRLCCQTNVTNLSAHAQWQFEEKKWYTDCGRETISSYFCEKKNGWMIMVGVVNETNVDEQQICQQRCCRWMRGDMDLIWSPRTITLWTAMKTWGDDVESRCGKHLWTNFRPLGVSKTCLDAGRDFNILLLSLGDSTAAKND